MDRSINPSDQWNAYIVIESRLFSFLVTSPQSNLQERDIQFFTDIPAEQALRYSLAQESIRQSLGPEANAFKDLLNQARAAFPLERQLAFRVNALNLSEVDKETIFKDYHDQITYTLPSIPIVYSVEQANKQYTELWDLPSYLDHFLVDDLQGKLGEMLELKKPYATLQDDRSWEKDDKKWDILVNWAAQKVHLLKNPKTLQSMSYENLRLPNDEDLASINSLIKSVSEKNISQLALEPMQKHTDKAFQNR